MKDKRAVTSQTISFARPARDEAERACGAGESLSLDGIVVHAATPHGHKMKPGTSPETVSPSPFATCRGRASMR